MAASEDLEMAVEQEAGPGASGRYPDLSLIHIYDTEELINQFSIKSYYYRASEMRIDWNDLAAVMEIKDLSLIHILCGYCGEQHAFHLIALKIHL